MGQEKILVVGATGYIGKHIAKASAELGHPTFALIRPSTLEDPAKAEGLASLKEAGVTLLPVCPVLYRLSTCKLLARHVEKW